jgi:hypothetical protein
MLIKEYHHDVPTVADGNGSMRRAFLNLLYPAIKLKALAGIYVFHPSIPGYPNARFPGVVVFSEIYQGS